MIVYRENEKTEFRIKRYMSFPYTGAIKPLIMSVYRENADKNKHIPSSSVGAACL